MRRIGTLTDENLARRFCDYLVTLSIDSTAEADSDGQGAAWNIWIRDEKDVEQARQELTTFQASPDEQRYQVQSEVAKIRDEQIAQQQRRLKQQRKMVQAMPAPSHGGMGPMMGTTLRQQSIPVTIAIIALSVVASFATNFGSPRSRGQQLTLEQKVYFSLSFVDRREFRQTGDPYQRVRQGEVWRFITPMFMHGDMMHLAFNMLCIYFLGTAIERLQGSLFLALLTLGTHAAGMALQVGTTGMDFLPEPLQGSPLAIGASGAAYGLFGYLWIRPALDPAYPVRLPPINIVVLLGWLVLCMTPAVENVANGAHLGGLMAGILVAMILPRKQ